jgi:hypothetical protein
MKPTREYIEDTEAERNPHFFPSVSSVYSVVDPSCQKEIAVP